MGARTEGGGWMARSVCAGRRSNGGMGGLLIGGRGAGQCWADNLQPGQRMAGRARALSAQWR
eukprot:2147705-Prymnesium_polylepis.1